VPIPFQSSIIAGQLSTYRMQEQLLIPPDSLSSTTCAGQQAISSTCIFATVDFVLIRCCVHLPTSGLLGSWGLYIVWTSRSARQLGGPN
jgi:hypothetical protein